MWVIYVYSHIWARWEGETFHDAWRERLAFLKQKEFVVSYINNYLQNQTYYQWILGPILAILKYCIFVVVLS